MNPVMTGAGTVTAAMLVPYVQWGLNGFHGPAPAGLAALIAGAVVTCGHAVYAFIKWKWFTPKQEQAHA